MMPNAIGDVTSRPVDSESSSALADPAHEYRLLAVARGAAALALIGAFVLPTLANLSALVAIVSFCFLPTARARLRNVMSKSPARAAVVLLAVLGVAMIWSDSAWIARLRAWWDWRPLLLMIICLAIFDEQEARRRALLYFIAVATLGAAYSFWAWAHGYSTAPQSEMPGSVLRNHVTQGMAFALAGFFAVMLATTQRELGPWLRGALCVAAAFLFANLAFVTFGRSGHLLLLILFAVTAMQVLKGWRRAAAIAALPIFAALAFSASPMLQTRFGNAIKELRSPLATEYLTPMGMRAVMWSVSWELLQERPVLGYGMGGFAPAYERALKRSSYIGWAATPTADPHNQYLQVQLQAGIAGTAAFVWFLLACFHQPAPQPYRAWALAILVGWCTTSLASSHFTTFAESHMLLILLGMLLSGAATGVPQRDGSIARSPISR